MGEFLENSKGKCFTLNMGLGVSDCDKTTERKYKSVKITIWLLKSRRYDVSAIVEMVIVRTDKIEQAFFCRAINYKKINK